jgi:hypothetical protein
MTSKTLVVTYPLDEEGREIIAGALDGVSEIIGLADQAPETRAEILSNAEVLLARNISKELSADELGLVSTASLLQFVSAGIDFIPLGGLPTSLRVAFNGGGYAKPMAEHGMAMALAAAKRLIVEHDNLKRGDFNQFTTNRMLAGGVAGILGFGGIGVASARLLRGLGMSIHAINRRGASDEATDWIGRPADLDELVAAADVLVVSLPLTMRYGAHDRRAGAGAHETGRDPDQSGAWRDDRRGGALRSSARASGFHRLHRRVVGGTSAPWRLSHGSAISRSAQCHRLAAQFRLGARLASNGAGQGRRQLPARAAWRPALAFGRTG